MSLRLGQEIQEVLRAELSDWRSRGFFKRKRVGRNSEAYCAAGLLADYAALIRPTG
jgi:hypothetical protein